MCLNHPESSPFPLVHRRIVFHKTSPWCGKGWMWVEWRYVNEHRCVCVDIAERLCIWDADTCAHIYMFGGRLDPLTLITPFPYQHMF